MVAGRPARKVADESAAKSPEEDGAARAKRPATSFKKVSPISSPNRGPRKPGSRVVQDLTGIATNGVAKAAATVEKTVERMVAGVVGGGSEAFDVDGEETGASGESDLHEMKLADLRAACKGAENQGTLGHEEGGAHQRGSRCHTRKMCNGSTACAAHS